MTEAQSKDCYGLSWEERHPECAGGLDPMFSGVGGTKIRPRCDMYESCGRAFKTAEAQRKLQGVAFQQVVPANNLVRQQGLQPYQPPPPPVVRPQFLPPQPPRPYQAPIQVQPQYAQPQQPQYVPNQQMMHPQYYPAIFSQAQSLLPHEAAPFLTVTEEKQEGVPMWRRILLESLRAGVKGVLQQGAFIVDHTPYYHLEAGKR